MGDKKLIYQLLKEAKGAMASATPEQRQRLYHKIMEVYKVVGIGATSKPSSLAADYIKED